VTQADCDLFTRGDFVRVKKDRKSYYFIAYSALDTAEVALWHYCYCCRCSTLAFVGSTVVEPAAHFDREKSA
jgi:hypothetical protein